LNYRQEPEFNRKAGQLSAREDRTMIETQVAIRFNDFGSSPFSMGKVIFQFKRVGFREDIHTKQRRAMIS